MRLLFSFGICYSHLEVVILTDDTHIFLLRCLNIMGRNTQDTCHLVQKDRAEFSAGRFLITNGVQWDSSKQKKRCG